MADEITDEGLAELRRRMDPHGENLLQSEADRVVSLVPGLLARLERERDEAREEVIGLRGASSGAIEILTEQNEELRVRIATLEAALRHLSAMADTLSPQEIINNAATALGVDPHEYGGSGAGTASNIELVRLVDLDDAARHAMLLAVSELSRTVAPLLAVFREGEGGSVESEQVDAAVSAMAEVQRCEAAFGALWFERRAALRGVEGKPAEAIAKEAADAAE